MNGIASSLTPRVDPYDSTGTELADTYIHCVPVIEAEHYMTHKGNAFALFGKFTIAGTSTVYIQLKTDGVATHIRRYLNNVSSNNILYTVYEAPTVTDGTVVIPSFNLNRISSAVATNVFYNNPTSVSGGTQLAEVYLPASRSTGGSSDISSYESIYKQNTNYVAKIDNLQAGNALFYFNFFWYELAM